MGELSLVVTVVARQDEIRTWALIAKLDRSLRHCQINVFQCHD